jgi:hypothetical protein
MGGAPKDDVGIGTRSRMRCMRSEFGHAARRLRTIVVQTYHVIAVLDNFHSHVGRLTRD